jgi:hypothetical protein
MSQSKRCKKEVGSYFAEPLLCNGIIIERSYVSNGITFSYEVCARCGKKPTLEELVIKEKEIKKQILQY